MTDCKTKSVEPYCENMYNGYVCTRKKGHKGKHHAHGPAEECYMIWDEY